MHNSDKQNMLSIEDILDFSEYFIDEYLVDIITYCNNYTFNERALKCENIIRNNSFLTLLHPYIRKFTSIDLGEENTITSINYFFNMNKNNKKKYALYFLKNLNIDENKVSIIICIDKNILIKLKKSSLVLSKEDTSIIENKLKDIKENLLENYIGKEYQLFINILKVIEKVISTGILSAKYKNTITAYRYVVKHKDVLNSLVVIKKFISLYENNYKFIILAQNIENLNKEVMKNNSASSLDNLKNKLVDLKKLIYECPCNIKAILLNRLSKIDNVILKEEIKVIQQQIISLEQKISENKEILLNNIENLTNRISGLSNEVKYKHIFQEKVNSLTEIYENQQATYKKINELKENYGFEGFFHTTSFDNFINIMKVGKIYSRYNDKNILFFDIANQDVVSQQVREHNYVRFYFRPKTPTNYRNEGIKCIKSLSLQDQNGHRYNNAHSPIPVIMIFNSDLALNNDCRYKQANKQNVPFNNHMNNLSHWSEIFSNDFYDKNNPNWENEKHFRMAELLYPEEVDTNKIIRIIFRTVFDKKRAENLIGDDDRFFVDSKYFINNYLYVTGYMLDKNNLRITFSYNRGYSLKNDNVNISDYRHKLEFKYNKQIVAISEDIIINESEYESKFNIPNNIVWDEMIYYIEEFECIRIGND